MQIEVLGERNVNREDKRRIIKILLCVGLIISLVVVLFGYIVSHNKSYKNEAVERGDTIFLNGNKYCYSKLTDDYSISNVLICTTDSNKKIYEIKEYPNYEYIAVYSAWDGSIYKKE